MRHAKCYVPTYPRIQFVRDSYTNLNGKWDFVFLPEDFRLCDITSITFDRTINVPYSYQTKLSEINDEKHHTYIAYRKKIKLEAKDEKDIVLNFEAVDYECWLYVNGTFIGTHKGGYTRFSFEISSALVIGDNEITLVVKDGIEADKVRGKQSWMPNPWGCWYTATNGIWKSVWIEQVSHTRLNSVKVFPKKDNDSLLFEYDINAFRKGVSLTIIISYDDKLIQKVRLEPHSEHGNVEISIKNEYEPFRVQQWAPEHPNIFDIEYILEDNQGELDHVGSYTAYKSFERKGSLLYLNNNPTMLKMVLFQGYYKDGMTPESENEYLEVVKLCKEIGLNGIRVHQKLESELFYYYCDIMGLMAFLEIPSPYEFSLRTINNLQNEFMEALNQYSNHPSIICYVPINESWGLPHISTSKREMDLASSLYYLAKSYDPDRLCIDNDGWEHTENTDILSIHNYEQDPEKLARLYEDLENVLKDKNNTMNCRALNDIGYTYKGQPILLDEFVGTSYESSEGWGYGSTVKNDKEYEARLEKLILSAKNNPYLAGFCITQFNDTYQETNGLFDKDMKPKLPLATLRRIIG